MTASVGAVAIGRNEGTRLHLCLTTLQQQTDRIVYVDSGSGDGSVAYAESLGISVVQLDTTTPFTAARARNAGFAALQQQGLPDFVQFVDGDCGVAEGWINTARSFLERAPDAGLVTGWRTEIHPYASIYNAMAEVEWHRPAGQITTCGGDMMVRSDAFEAVGGFNPAIIAAEDDDLCLRIGQAGYTLHRLPHGMTRHDAAMTTFGQWWRRAVRAGHGFAQVGALHSTHFRRERLRAWLFGLIFPLVAFLGLVWWPLLTWVALAVFALSWARTAISLARDNIAPPAAPIHAAFLTLSKLPNVIGMITFHLRRLRGRAMHIIEYR